MRKKLVVCVIIALALFVSASPWEGAAATAPEGELPGNGRYIATNSFPKNTVVDITNIETNKSTRVIVANNLDSPGLLAIVSREAAELIGMRPGSVSRITMTQPSDPVAYVRFTEGLSSGITDYDSGDVITEETYGEEFVNPASAPSRVSSAAARENDVYDAYPASPFAGAPPPAAPSYAAAPDTGYPAYVLEPEWSGARSGARSARDIVDLPVYADGGKKTDEPESIAKTEPAKPEEIAEISEDEYYEDDYFDEPEEIAESVEEFFEEPEEIAEISEDEYYEDDYFDEPEEVVEYNIVPTDDRPPSSIYGIDPAFIIPGITRASEPETANNPIHEPDFSIPRIYELARGSYYVQLAAFDTAESVESNVSRIDQHYKPVVYKDSDRWYRVLLGPLNQGESAAVLARFKSIGYKDAFVRLAR